MPHSASLCPMAFLIAGARSALLHRICKYRRTSSNYYFPHPPLFPGVMFHINYLHSNPYFRDGFWRIRTKSHLYSYMYIYAHINIKLPWLGERNTIYVSRTEKVLSQPLHYRNYWEEGTRKQNRFHLQEKYLWVQIKRISHIEKAENGTSDHIAQNHGCPTMQSYPRVRGIVKIISYFLVPSFLPSFGKMIWGGNL